MKKETIVAIVFASISVFLGSFGQLFMKVGMKGFDLYFYLNRLTLFDFSTVSEFFPLFWVATGLVFYIGAMFCWLIVLARLELSVAYPILSLGYVIVYIGAVFWGRLSEEFSITKTCGVLVIILGVWLATSKLNIE